MESFRQRGTNLKITMFQVDIYLDANEYGSLARYFIIIG